MKLQCALAAVALCAGVSHADLTDTFTAGIAAIAVDPNDPIGSLDFGNANVIAGASSLIPGFSPMVGGGPTALFDPIANEGAGGVSPITVQANTDLIGDLMTIDSTWSTSNGSQIFSNVNPAFFILPDGANATHIVLDTGNYFGAGGAVFPRDGIDIGSAWSFVSGTVTAQLPGETDVDPLQWCGDSSLAPARHASADHMPGAPDAEWASPAAWPARTPHAGSRTAPPPFQAANDCLCFLSGLELFRAARQHGNSIQRRWSLSRDPGACSRPGRCTRPSAGTGRPERPTAAASRNSSLRPPAALR